MFVISCGLVLVICRFWVGCCVCLLFCVGCFGCCLLWFNSVVVSLLDVLGCLA